MTRRAYNFNFFNLGHDLYSLIIVNIAACLCPLNTLETPKRLSCNYNSPD